MPDPSSQITDEHRWDRAVAHAVILSASLAVALAASAGGWRGLVGSPGGFWILDEGAQPVAEIGRRIATVLPGPAPGAWFAAFAALLIPTAARARWRAAEVLCAAMALSAVAWWGTSGCGLLGYETVVLRSVPSGSDADGQLSVSITMWPVVGLLLGFTLATAGFRAARRRRPIDDHAPAWVSPKFIGAAVVAALALPRIALWLRDGVRSLSSVSEAELVGFGGEQTVCAFVIAIVVLVGMATVLRHRAPAIALGAALTCIPLWIPGGWVVLGLVTLPVDVDSTPIILALWAAWIAAGTSALRHIIRQPDA